MKYTYYLPTLTLVFLFQAALTQSTLRVENVGDIYAIGALFGPDLRTPISAEIVEIDDRVDPNNDGCETPMNNLDGKIALVSRGNCDFVTKVLNAQAAGAVAVVICNNDLVNPNLLLFLTGNDMGQVNIPVRGITLNDCRRIQTRLATGTTQATILPAFNNLCTEAQPIEPGTYQVDTIFADPVLNNLGGAPSHPEDATAAVWFSYTPSEDGIMTVSACEGGGDTRLWIHTGTCDLARLDLITLIGNDDACPFEPGNNEDLYASEVSLPVQADVTYWIEWDDKWENTAFSFSLDFMPQNFTMEAGQDCANAIEISTGMFDVDSISRFGQTELDNTYGSEWFRFVPNQTGLLSVTSCQGGADTRLLLHTGSCDELSLITESSSDCAAFLTDTLAASLEGIPVEQGLSYLIEWSGQESQDGFGFTVSLDTIQTVDVTFNVDMNLASVASSGVNLFYNVPPQEAIRIAALNDDNEDGIWSVTLPFNVLDTVLYVFANSNEQETVPAACRIDSQNFRQLVVNQSNEIVLDTICFESCKPCSPISCDEPRLLLMEGFEPYNLGTIGNQSDRWTTWDGELEQEGIVSAEQSFSGNQALKIEGDNGDQDALFLLNDLTEGHYILTWKLYVPEGQRAYYNIQKFQNAPGEEFAFQVQFNEDETGTLDAGGLQVADFSYASNEWIDIEHFIDLDNDIIRLYIDGSFVYAWKMSFSVFAPTGTKSLGAVNFFPAQGAHLYYVDDIQLVEIPTAAQGLYAHTASSVDVGIHSVPDLACFGANFNTEGENGQAGYWYNYTASENGYISLQTCDLALGNNTRIWVFQDSFSFNLQGINDNECLVESYLEVPVNQGETYYILFDNIHTNNGFDWELRFFPNPLPVGDFCHSAISADVGIISVAGLDGNNVVAGNTIGTTDSDFTPFSSSEWYTYIPPADGFLDVFSCDSLPEKTMLYVYEGSCGHENLILIASNENGCDENASTRNLPVEAGKPYYIEWASRGDDRHSFDFELDFFNPRVDVLFQVDMSNLATDGTLSGQGAYLGGSFNDFQAQQMIDEDGDNVFTLMLPLFKGDTIEYRYYNGPFSDEEIDLEFGTACVNAAGNRTLIIGEENITLEVNCFGFCTNCDIISDTDDLLSSNSFQVFPNPTAAQINIQFANSPTEIVELTLFNALGQTVNMQQTFSKFTSIEVSNLEKGVYFLQLNHNGKSKVKKVVVE